MSETFVRLTNSEFKLGFDDLFEAVVFASIKSWCSQGKREIDLSNRQIQSYIPLVALGTVNKKIKSLIDKKLIKIVGQKTRVGGTVPIYRVFTTRTPSTNKVFTGRTVSVHPVKESVHAQARHLGIKKKEYKEEKKEKRKIPYKQKQHGRTKQPLSLYKKSSSDPITPELGEALFQAAKDASFDYQGKGGRG